MRYYSQEDCNKLLSALYVKPELFDTPEATSISEADFETPIQKVAYSIMYNLYTMGHTKYSEANIEAYVKGRPQLNKFYNDKVMIDPETNVPQGPHYFSLLQLNGDPSNFEPSFETVKKLTMLRNLDRNGVTLNEFLDWDTTDPKIMTYQRDWFDKTNISEMADQISDKIQSIMDISSNGSLAEYHQAGAGMFDLIKSLKESPDFGAPSSVEIMDTVVRGQRLGKFYLFSAPTGGGKTRFMMAQACFSSITKKYNPKKRIWEDTGGAGEGAVLISTELDLEECQTLALSFITGIQEETILEGKFTLEEEELLLEASKLIAESNLYFVILPDFSIREIESIIRKYYREHDAKYFYFDYIHTSMKFLEELAVLTKGMKLREDQLLFMLSTKLKNLANQLHVFIQSATQVNGDYLEGELNQNLLRGRITTAFRTLIRFTIGVNR